MFAEPYVLWPLGVGVPGTSITLSGHRKDRQLISTTETDSFQSNPDMKAHGEAVWNKFNILTNNNLQIWPCLQLYAGCALLASLQQRISDWVIALVRLVFLICCTTISAFGLRSLWTLLSTDQERACSSFVFPSEQLSIITPQRSSLKVVHKKIPAFRPPLPCPHVAYPLLLNFNCQPVFNFARAAQSHPVMDFQ